CSSDLDRSQQCLVGQFQTVEDCVDLGAVKQAAKCGQCQLGATMLVPEGVQYEAQRLVQVTVCGAPAFAGMPAQPCRGKVLRVPLPGFLDRKSTRLNSSHVKISYAVFC